MLKIIVLVFLALLNAASGQSFDLLCGATPGGASCTTPAQSCTTTSNQANSSLGNTYRWKAAKFLASGTKTVCADRLKMGRVGNPSFTVRIRYYASTGSEPDESNILASGDPVAASAFVNSGLDWVDFPGQNFSQTDGVEYWRVVEVSALGDGSNYINIDSDTGCDYEEGILYSSNGTSWTASDAGRGWRYTAYE
jgi:hypothetical protein